MNYEEALTYIHSTYKFGSKLGLTNIKALLAKLGNPEKNLPVIHVAGTNGKGSVCSMLQSVLTAAGYKTGLYTSPYIQRFNERIRIDETMIPDEDLAVMTAEVKIAVEAMLAEGCTHPTEFEVVTAIGFLYFARESVDVLVLEVGLGGTGDSTNVVDQPLISVITPVDYDHMEYLGDTLAAIAGEKAGIIKPGCPVVVGGQMPEAMAVIEARAAALEAPLLSALSDTVTVHESRLEGQRFSAILGGVDYRNIQVALPGLHQVDNCLIALRVLQELPRRGNYTISQEALYQGLASVKWMGRLEILQHHPLFIIDGAHNLAGARSLAGSIERLLPDQPVTFLTGMMADKDVKGFLEILLPRIHQVVVTRPDNPRAMAAEELGRIIDQHQGSGDITVTVVPDPEAAVDKAIELTPENGVVICAGSLYLLGTVRQRVLSGSGA
ncbi:bifunctional folylpolyglutamate synthase/dihydrofolate synthase [Anoxynatronum buryatiense]|uniref:Dihydrofolate synthase/folylpolyglutamate synthase n=1 Tax=Anoxynatronum buryatiense TaxID=489973 RepID=A0AA45WTC8_9CLOT|nr:folylpolyglutamate synthase/dihydrofolate synthase family protein [Anoxynatronum buryatiense]SMP41258.1 dihydrofolate synthase / folylpolyglutamate synthase [Anoxynatronum buryatiense]